MDSVVEGVCRAAGSPEVSEERVHGIGVGAVDAAAGAHAAAGGALPRAACQARARGALRRAARAAAAASATPPAAALRPDAPHGQCPRQSPPSFTIPHSRLKAG